MWAFGNKHNDNRAQSREFAITFDHPGKRTIVENNERLIRLLDSWWRSNRIKQNARDKHNSRDAQPQRWELAMRAIECGFEVKGMNALM